MPHCQICGSKEHNYWQCNNYTKSDSCDFLTGYRRISPFEVMDGSVMEYGIGRDGLSITKHSLDRRLLQLESVGEPFLLFRRMWLRKDKSNACPCYETPRRQSKSRCPYSLCYGTGVVGGYRFIPGNYRKDGTILIRIPPTQRDVQLNKTQGGLAQMYEPDQCWTMPYPAIYQRDMLVRFDDCGVELGRYEVMQMTYARGFPANTIVGQYFKIKEMDRTDELYKVPIENFLIPLLPGEKYGPGRLYIDLDIDTDSDGYVNQEEYLEGTHYKENSDYPSIHPTVPGV